MNTTDIVVTIAVLVFGVPAGAWLIIKSFALPKLTPDEIKRAERRKMLQYNDDPNGG